MKAINILFIFVLLCTVMYGCAEKPLDTNALILVANDQYYYSFLNSDEAESSNYEDNITIYEGISFGEVIKKLGVPIKDSHNSFYPIYRSWILKDGSQLEIRFESETNEEFWEAFRNGDYKLAEETVQFDEKTGIRFATDNELKALKNWYNSLKAVSAVMISNNGIVSTLF